MEAPHSSLQENILTLLCFDNQHAEHVATIVESDLFESKIYRDIAQTAREFVTKYNKPPKDHIADLLGDRLEDEKKGELYRDVLTSLHDMQGDINAEYVLDSLHDWVHQQSLKGTILEAAQLVQDGQVHQAETLLDSNERRRDRALQIGTRLWNQPEFFKFLHKEQSDVFMTGIGPLDKHYLGPMRKGLWVTIAPAKRGKSWLLVHLGKMGLLQNKKVLHLTLEMPEEEVAQRYVRSFLGVTKRKGIKLSRTYIEKSKRTLMATRLEFKRIRKRVRSLEDPDFESWASKQLEKLHLRNLVIKEFPTGMLTVGEYEAYLDSLARIEGFHPDIVIVDYPDLFDLGVKDSDNYRLALGKLYQRIRGNAKKRNHAAVVVTQSNRSGAGSKTVHDVDVAEDWSKIATADFVGTYTRTFSEKQLGLARLFVSNARGERDTFEVLLSQNLDIGQFCIDSAELPNQYERMLNELEPDNTDEDED